MTKKGRKYGWHIDYLDRAWHIVEKDSSYYYRYSYYATGKSYDPILIDYKEPIRKISQYNTDPKKGEPIPLNGAYGWLYSDGTRYCDVAYRNGFRVGPHTLYQWRRPWKLADFDRKASPLQDFSFYFVIYKKDGSVTDKGYYTCGEYKKKFMYMIFLESIAVTKDEVK